MLLFLIRIFPEGRFSRRKFKYREYCFFELYLVIFSLINLPLIIYAKYCLIFKQLILSTKDGFTYHLAVLFFMIEYYVFYFLGFFYDFINSFFSSFPQ